MSDRRPFRGKRFRRGFPNASYERGHEFPEQWSNASWGPPRHFRGRGADERFRRGGLPNGPPEHRHGPEFSEQSPQERGRPPSHLRGREIGMWYRNQGMKAKRDGSMRRKRKRRCYEISFNAEREQMIEKYLNAVDKEPSCSIPLSEYRKRLKTSHPLHDRATNEYLSSGSAVVKEEPRAECSSRESNDFERNSMRKDVGSNDNSDLIDKYEYLEDSSFKQRFLSVISCNIQEKLQNAGCHRATHATRIEELDEELYQVFVNKEQSARYQQMMSERRNLPAFQAQKTILKSIDQNQVLLISGETGCGKTTQVAQFILDEAIRNRNGSLCNIICTQPRRISAISVAQRVADERTEVLGQESVGYQIRLEKKIGRDRGSILFCTTGIVLQMMQGDPSLSKYSHIILDEIHERDTLCDFTMTILKDIAAKRKDLKIVLMSATLNAERFSTYFWDCPRINIPGYTYPVQEFYLEDVLLSTKYRFSDVKRQRNWRGRNRNVDEEAEAKANFKKHIVPYAESLAGSYPDFVIEGLCNPESEKVNTGLIVELIKHICVTKEPGAILVFVPGWDTIQLLTKRMQEEDHFFEPSSYCIIPLHSLLPTGTQLSVFDRPPPGVRKIVIATNIAETSITINDVVYVIDCGQMKVKNYDVDANISTLKPEFVSRANALQRKGRAGRVQSGICYHLFSRGRERILDDYPLPEMVRTRLEEVILNIKILKLGKAAPFLEKVLDPPNPQAVSLAIRLLIQVNALDENENLTPLGFHLAKLPLEPQIGKMLLMAVTMSCLNPILSIAAALSFKDPFQIPFDEEIIAKQRKLEFDSGFKSDHLIFAEAMDCWERQERQGSTRDFCWRNYLNENIMRQLRQQKALFAQYLVDLEFMDEPDYKRADLNVNKDNVSLLRAVICSGLYPNVVIITRQINTTRRKLLLLRTSEDGKVTLHPKSVNTVQQTPFEYPFLMYHEKLLSTSIMVYDSTMVSTLPLLIFCHNLSVTYSTTEKRATIELNKDLRFKCSTKTAHYITELKVRFQQLLEQKLSHPDQVLWKHKNAERGILRMLTELFTHENDLLTKAVMEYGSDTCKNDFPSDDESSNAENDSSNE